MTDSNPTPPSDSLVGKLLVASSLADDAVLAQSVSLIVHQDDEHVVAVMLNRPMTPNPSTLLQMLDDPPTVESGSEIPVEDDLDDRLLDEFDDDLSEDSDEGPNRIGHLAAQAEKAAADVASSIGLVHFGGPLSGPVVAVHGLSEFAEAETGNGVYVAAQKQLLENLVRHKPGPFRLIVGHLGWSLPQFAQEFGEGRWHLIDATSDAVLKEDSEMWPRLIRRATSSSVARWIGVPDLPGAAALN